MVGHTFPLYRKGGKVLDRRRRAHRALPWIVVGLAVVWFVVAPAAQVVARVVARRVAFPIAVTLTGHDVWEDVVVAALAVLIIGRHASNIRRLLRREELDARKT